MKSVKGIVLILAIIVASTIQSPAVVDQAIAVQGTNLVLSWPSQGYEYYMIQYWPDLSMPSIQLTNCVPANSTNRTTFIIPCCTMAGLGGGSGTNSGGGSIEPPGASMAMSGASPSDESDWGSDLWVVQSDGSELPLKMYPPGIDTNGMVLIDTPPADTENESTPSFGANSFGGAAETPAGITNGGCDCPSYGFFRVWHIPNWLASFTNYTFDGPTFVPIDFKDYRDRVENTTVLVNGQPTPYAQLIQLEMSGQMYWGRESTSNDLRTGQTQFN